MKNLTVMLGRTLVATMFVVATPAWGQEAPLTPAQTLFESGREASNAGRWPDAVRMFSESYKLEAEPRTAAWLGRAQVESGDYVAGAANLELYLREEKEPSEKMKQSVTKTLARAKEKVVTVELVINQPDAEVFVDKEKVDSKRVTWPIYLLPGGHSFEVKKAGFTPYRLEKVYKPGEAPTIDVNLERVGVVAKKDSENKAKAVPPLAIAGFAVGGGLLVTAAITGGLANQASQRAADAAMSTGCIPGENCRGIFDQEYGRSTALSAVALASLGVGTGIGIAALVHTMAARRASDAADAPKTSWNVSPTLGGFAVQGTW